MTSLRATLLLATGPIEGGDPQTLATAETVAESLAGNAPLWWRRDMGDDMAAAAVERLAEEVGGTDYARALKQLEQRATSDAFSCAYSALTQAAYYVGLARGWHAAQQIGGAR